MAAVDSAALVLRSGAASSAPGGGRAVCQTMNWLHAQKLTVETNAHRQRRLQHEEKEGKQSKSDKDKLVHNILCLGGGKAFVPTDLWDIFLLKYAADVSNGVEMSFSEVEPSLDLIRKLVADFDHKRYDRFITFAEVLEHIKVMQDVVNLFFPTGDNSAYLMQREDVLVEKPNEPLVYSSGYHLIWPKVLATGHNCRRVRAAWVMTLQDVFGVSGSPHRGNPGFDKIVDNDIYVGGLRLFGSSKIEVCRACKGKKTGWCFECKEYNGKVNLGRKYVVTHQIAADGTARPLTETEAGQYRTLAERCTIRSRQIGRSDFRVPPGAPEAVEKKAGTSRKRKTPTGEAESKQLLDSTSREWKAFANFAATRLPAEHRRMRITNITASPKRNFFTVYSDSHHCENLGSAHRGRTVMWKVERFKKHVYQQCQCDCDKVRPSGIRCRDYNRKAPHHRTITLSEELSAILFASPVVPLPLGAPPNSVPAESSNTQTPKPTRKKQRTNSTSGAGGGKGEALLSGAGAGQSFSARLLAWTTSILGSAGPRRVMSRTFGQ